MSKSWKIDTGARKLAPKNAAVDDLTVLKLHEACAAAAIAAGSGVKNPQPIFLLMAVSFMGVTEQNNIRIMIDSKLFYAVKSVLHAVKIAVSKEYTMA